MMFPKGTKWIYKTDELFFSPPLVMITPGVRRQVRNHYGLQEKRVVGREREREEEEGHSVILSLHLWRDARRLLSQIGQKKK